MGFHQLTTYLDSLEDIYGIHNLDCLIQREHQVVYRHLAGHSDYEQKIPVKETDLYFFFSATKLMTMTAAVQLIEQGKLHLYDPVWNYLPEYEVMYILDREFPIGVFPAEMPKRGEASHYAATQMRIIDLMSMTAGLTYDTQSEAIREVIRQTGGKAGTREIVRAIAKMPLIFEPGTRWAYSLGHDVMAAVIEEVSGERFSDYLKRHIFEPLEAEELYFKLPDHKKPSALYGYDYQEKKIQPIPQKNQFQITEQYESGGAGLMGTVEAYAKVVDALANGGVGANGARILKEESVELFTHSVTTGKSQEDFKKSGKGAYGYGLGVRVKNSLESGRTPIGEFGWDGAAGAYVLVDPIHRISMFYTQHVVGFGEAYTTIHPTIRDLAYEAMGL